jgi:hypothetical protein
MLGEGASFGLYQHPKKGGSVSAIARYPDGGVEIMINKRFQFGDRRENYDMPKVPFKDSDGVTINECRRRIPGRRMIKIQGEWVDEIVIG